jgi:hypothetical protein
MCIDKVQALPTSEAEKQMILAGNARRLLKINDVLTAQDFRAAENLVDSSGQVGFTVMKRSASTCS